jgi:aerobic C4-dicarboxylate transport protein
VLTAIAIGATIGAVRPDWGQALQPLGEGFIRLVKMVVGPIIFLTIVVGIAGMGDLKKVGRVGGKALIYFEIVTTIALAIGLLVANVVKPGVGVDTSAARSQAIAATNPSAGAAGGTQVQQYAAEAKKHSTSEFLLNVIPDNVVGAFAKGDLLQILFFAVLFGTAVAGLGERASGIVGGLERLIEVMFRIVAIVMKVAPIGAMGAMAYTVGKFGLSSLLPLVKLMACVYLTMALFIFVVLGAICRVFGVSLLRYLAFIREEIVLVLGTSSSESALPRMIEKLEIMGCGRAVVGMVIPAGYSFNLDGTSIYLSMAVLFIAQAFGVHLGFWQQVSVMGILMLTSKGAAAVTGSGFVTLAATLAATHVLPVEGLALLLGVDRFMSEARAITNLIGNGVATIVVSKMEGEFDVERYEAAMAGRPLPLATPEVLADEAAAA